MYFEDIEKAMKQLEEVYKGRFKVLIQKIDFWGKFYLTDRTIWQWDYDTKQLIKCGKWE
jgi:hypothetical protein